MRLGWKIFGASALVIAVLVGVAVWSLGAMAGLVTANRDIVTRSAPALQIANALRDSLDRLERLEARYLVRRDAAYAADWEDRAERLAADLEQLGALISTASERSALGRVSEEFAAYRRHFEAERALVARGRVEPAQRIADGPARAAATAAETGLVDLIAASEAALARAQVEAGALEARTRRAIVVALVLGVLAALGASAALALGMTRSLRRLTSATTELADGAFTEPLPANRRDEIGELARSFNRMAERLEEVERQKQQFFSHISHDLRSPLTALLASAQLLLARGSLEQRQENLVQIMQESAKRMLGMINQIMDYSRLRAPAAAPMERRVVDVAKLVSRAVDELGAQAEQQGLALGASTDGAAFDVEGDDEALGRVITNLVGNAIKFTPSGGSIAVHLAEVGDRVELSVKDTGLGIPADALPTIFDPYRRAHRGLQGSGLGLAVVKGLVETHGGTIAVESVEGQGSCFTVSFPQALRPE
jgi:signal transduction histidine kinase